MQESEALARWRGVVAHAEDGVAAQPELSESEERRIPAILYPATLREVQDIVDEARTSKTPLYPVSTGMNWGLGSRHPVRDDCVLVDLRRLDRIRELHLAHGYAVIEAGVSQHALAQRLEGTPWMLNVTTSCKDSGLLGNAMDRGEGCIRPRRDDLLGLELVLGDGSVLHTGGVGQGAARRYHGLGTGPDATDLFLQSSLGIATAGAFAFLPRPERIDYAFASFRRAGLAEVVDTVLALRRERVLDTTFRLSELPVEAGRTGAAPDFTLLGPLLGRRAAVDATEAVLREELGRLPSFRSFECGPVADMPLTHPLYQRTQFFRGIPSCDMLRARFSVDELRPRRPQRERLDGGGHRAAAGRPRGADGAGRGDAGRRRRGADLPARGQHGVGHHHPADDGDLVSARRRRHHPHAPHAAGAARPVACRGPAPGARRRRCGARRRPGRRCIGTHQGGARPRRHRVARALCLTGGALLPSAHRPGTACHAPGR